VKDVKDPKQSEVFQQIQQTFQQAQGQMAQLRNAVERTAELARMKAESDYLVLAKKRALEELGEAIFKLAQKGKLELPATVAPLVKAVEEADRKAEVQASAILDILKEGEEVAARLKGKNDAPVNKVVAPRPKKS
jgi:CO dehydrogenase/acetyl-CoA synthase epsilon subunit